MDEYRIGQKNEILSLLRKEFIGSIILIILGYGLALYDFNSFELGGGYFAALALFLFGFFLFHKVVCEIFARQEYLSDYTKSQYSKIINIKKIFLAFLYLLLAFLTYSYYLIDPKFLKGLIFFSCTFLIVSVVIILKSLYGLFLKNGGD